MVPLQLISIQNAPLNLIESAMKHNHHFSSANRSRNFYQIRSGLILEFLELIGKSAILRCVIFCPFQLALLFITMMLIEMNVDETVNDTYTSYNYLGHAEYCWNQYQLHKDEYFRV